MYSLQLSEFGENNIKYKGKNGQMSLTKQTLHPVWSV